MKILFLSHYFPPEVNAPASRTYDHCKRWVRAGHDVTVITCVPNCPDGIVYEGYKNTFRRQTEYIDGIRVVRVWSYLAPNAGTARRIINYLSFAATAILAALRLPRPDVLIATSPQFFCGWAGVLASRMRRVPFVLEIRDIWPEGIEAVGALQNRWLLRTLEWLERRMYCSAGHIVTVGNGYRDKIIEKAAVADRISVIPNGVDLELFTPRPPEKEFLQKWGLQDRFVCSWTGTIGMTCGLEVLLEAANTLKQKGRTDICFCLVGDGALRKRLQEMVKEGGLGDMIVFVGRQPKDRMPSILASSHACLVHLKKHEHFEALIPSKIFEMLAMRRPIIMGVRGQSLDIVNKAGAGVTMEPESAESLVKAVETLADDPELALRLGRAAREYVVINYNRDILADTFLRMLLDFVGMPKPDEAAADSLKTENDSHDPVEQTDISG